MLRVGRAQRLGDGGAQPVALAACFLSLPVVLRGGQEQLLIACGCAPRAVCSLGAGSAPDPQRWIAAASEAEAPSCGHPWASRRGPAGLSWPSVGPEEKTEWRHGRGGRQQLSVWPAGIETSAAPAAPGHCHLLRPLPLPPLLRPATRRAHKHVSGRSAAAPVLSQGHPKDATAAEAVSQALARVCRVTASRNGTPDGQWLRGCCALVASACGCNQAQGPALLVACESCRSIHCPNAYISPAQTAPLRCTG